MKLEDETWAQALAKTSEAPGAHVRRWPLSCMAFRQPRLSFNLAMEIADVTGDRDSCVPGLVYIQRGPCLARRKSRHQLGTSSPWPAQRNLLPLQ